MQRQATESMKQKVGMGAMGHEKTSKWDESRWRNVRYIECHFLSSIQRSTWQMQWKRLRKNNSLKLLQRPVTLEVIKKYQKVYRRIKRCWLRDFLVHRSLFQQSSAFHASHVHRQASLIRAKTTVLEADFDRRGVRLICNRSCLALPNKIWGRWRSWMLKRMQRLWTSPARRQNRAEPMCCFAKFGNLGISRNCL